MGLPPIQRIDHIPVVILQEDSAWDRDRINYEAGVLRGDEPDERGRPPFEKWEHHPVYRYHAGDTRYDIGPAEQYLREGDEPSRFTLRRLSHAEFVQVETMQGQGRGPEARLYALKRGLAEVSGLDGFTLPTGNDHVLDEQAIAKLRARIGDNGLTYLGNAVIIASRRLTEPEKKQ